MWNFSKTLFQTHKSFEIEYKLCINIFKWFTFQKQERRPTKNSSVAVCDCINQNMLGTQCGVLVDPVIYGKYPILIHPLALWYWAPAAVLGKRGCFISVCFCYKEVLVTRLHLAFAIKGGRKMEKRQNVKYIKRAFGEFRGRAKLWGAPPRFPFLVCFRGSLEMGPIPLPSASHPFCQEHDRLSWRPFSLYLSKLPSRWRVLVRKAVMRDT